LFSLSNQEMLLALAQAVANATAALVLKAKAIAKNCDDVTLQSQVIGSAKDTAMTTSQLVACTKVLAPSINSQLCKDQVVEAAKLVSKAVEGTEGACKVKYSEIHRVFAIYFNSLSCAHFIRHFKARLFLA
jgi:talin